MFPHNRFLRPYSMLIHSKEQWGVVPGRNEDEENATDCWYVFLAFWYNTIGRSTVTTVLERRHT